MARKRGKGRAVRRARQKFGTYYESEELKQAPHSMVIHRGHVHKNVRELVADMRKVMEPFTASELASSKRNTLKDFIAIAGPLHVTHLLIFTQNAVDPTTAVDYMKIVRLPRGPTIHFKVLEYSLRRDVMDALKRKHTHQKQFLMQPLLVLNGFSGAKAKSEDQKSPVEIHLKLMATTLQNMFPSINVTKINLDEVRRCVMFNYNKEDETIDFRQYYIRLLPLGLSKPIKKLIQEDVPDLSNFQDISEYIEKSKNFSESEAELDGPDNEVEVKEKSATHQASSGDKTKTTKRAIRLSEIGPRLKLKLIKIQEGVCDGEVLYHSLIKKTPEEIGLLREKSKKLKRTQNKIKHSVEPEKRPNLKRKREDEYEEEDADDAESEEEEKQDEDGGDGGDLEKEEKETTTIVEKRKLKPKAKFLRFSSKKKAQINS